MKIELPKKLDEDEVAEFLSVLSNNRDIPETINLDFSAIKFARPFGTLISAEAIRLLKAYRLKKGLKTMCLRDGIVDPPFSVACSYLKHIGFFKYMGWAAGKEPAEALGGESYLPITIQKSIEFGLKQSSKELAESIKIKSYQLSRIVFDAEDAQEILAYCFREIIRNALEHSGVSRCSIMAQKYQGSVVEIAVIDSGCGIRASLSQAFPNIDALSSLNYAIQPGVSSTVVKKHSNQEDDINTGFGLYVLSELGKLYGEFVLWSEEQEIVVNRYFEKKTNLRSYLRGTAVKIRLDTTDGEYFPNLLKSIVDAGEAKMPSYAKRQDGPSKSSRRIW